MVAEAFLSAFLANRPVHATFMGLKGGDGDLPRADAAAMREERRAFAALAAELAGRAEPDDAGERLDLRIARAETAIALAEAEHRPRQRNPAWYTGEAMFGVISLLLPQSEPVRKPAVRSRLEAIPDFLDDALAQLDVPTPRTWVERARREANALARFLNRGMRQHPEYMSEWEEAARRAAQALERFTAAIGKSGDADAACGEAYLAFLMRTAHEIELTPAQALAEAEAAFAELSDELVEMAAHIDPGVSWQDQLAALAEIQPTRAEVVDTYRALNARALTLGGELLSPAAEYGLDYRPMSPAFADIARASYFLSYRCPPAHGAGEGSVYWISEPSASDPAALRAHNIAAIKTTHAAHHGSIGHHTQNARARAAPSRLARLGGTDCASAIAFLSSGTMAEGWACYATQLLLEAQDYYTLAEALLLKHGERRNAASVIADIKLHTGAWSLEETMRFYRDEAGFAPSRVEAEVVRNSIFPASRLMYRHGVEAIKGLRRRWLGTGRSFHDTLIGFGHVPVAWAGEVMARAGLLRS
jgi:uncharacterized protein (DUF885 family)